MKNFLVVLLGVAAGIFLTSSYLEYRSNRKAPLTSAVSVKESPSFSIATPPSDSLKGQILSRSGKLLWESRTATQPAELDGVTSLSQGERIVTDKKSGVVLQFDRFGKITMSEESDLSFPQTLPVDFVVNQRKGKIEYEIAGEVPLSIRIRNALVTKKSGRIKIEMADDDPVILISTIEGTGTIGFNDTDGASQVFTLRDKQVYEYNSDERTAVNQAIK